MKQSALIIVLLMVGALSQCNEHYERMRRTRGAGEAEISMCKPAEKQGKYLTCAAE
jgi:hypothetical protein